MTKKHFAAIAAAFARRYIDTADEPSGPRLFAEAQLDALAGDLSRIFSDFNPTFDRACFLRACRGDN